MAITAIAIAMLTATATVAAMAASDRFGDVAAGHPHEEGIGFVVDSDVTAGCGDGSDYCPSDEVTRAQMATFLHRLSGHSPDADPSVDAATVQGMDPDDLRGQDGEDGADGQDGEDGADGQDGVAGRVLIDEEEMFTSSESQTIVAECPDGKTVLGGGQSQSGTTKHLVLESAPTADDDGWQVTYYLEKDLGPNDSADPKASGTAYAICADVN